MAANLADFLQGDEAPTLGDVAFTLQDGRRALPWRLAVAAAEPELAVAALRGAAQPVRKSPGQAPGTVFMFPGQGSQYPGMGAGLYAAEPTYARWIDRGTEVLEGLVDFDMRKALCEVAGEDADVARALKDTRVTQPALYLVEYATAALFLEKGVTPKAMIGHSVGEFAAAAHAGVFDFETGLRIIAEPGRLMQDQPTGAMLAVFAERERLASFLGEGVELAAMNAPQLQVVAGSDKAISDVERTLSEAGMSTARLHTSHAFHSAMMDPVVGPLKALISKMKLDTPKVAIQSTVTGAVLTAEEATDPAYWAGQARAAVNFEAAFRAANGTGSDVFVEMGAGRTLSTFARQILGGDSQGRVLQSLPDHTQTIADDQTLAAALGNLWAAGVPLDWSLTGPRGSRRVPLPAYPFQRESYWIEPARAAAQATARRSNSGTNSRPHGTPSAERTPSMPNLDAPSRASALQDRIAAILSELSGVSVGPEQVGEGFLDLGFDSLFLTQAARAIGAEFGSRLTVRCLLADHPSVAALARHLDGVLPADVLATVEETLNKSEAVAEGEPAGLNRSYVPDPIATVPDQVVVSGADFDAMVQTQIAAMQTLFDRQLATFEALAKKLPDVHLSRPEKPKVAIAESEVAVVAPGPLRLTTAQQEMWSMHQLGTVAACCFNQGLALRLSGALDRGRLEAALNALVARHDALRLRFKPASELVTVSPASDIDLPLRDLAGADDPDAAFAAILAEEANTPLDLVAAGPICARLVRFASERHVLLLTMHHAVCDGLSFNLIAGDLADLYGAYGAGDTTSRAPAPSFAAYLAGPGAAEADPAMRDFWRARLGGADQSLDLPLDRSRPATQSFRAASTSDLIEAGTIAELRDFGAKQGITLFGVLLGSLQILLSRLSGADAVTVAIPSGRRRTPDEDRTVGNFVHLLPVRNAIDADAPVAELLKRAASGALEAISEDDLTQNAIQKELGAENGTGPVSMTQVMFNLRRQAEARLVDGLSFEMEPCPKAASQFDLFFNTIETEGGLRIEVDFAADILNEDTVRRWISHWKTMLGALPAAASSPAGRLPLLSATDIDAIDRTNRRASRDFDLAVSIPVLLARQVTSRPNAIAVDDAGASLTYGDLDRRSDALAALIQSRLGVDRQRIGVAMPRGRDMLVALLGVLKAGHVYVPLDPRQPKARLEGILATAEASAVIASEDKGMALAQASVALINPGDAQTRQRPVAVPHDPNAAAYVIFTLGSTGTPKGVEVSHAAAMNFLQSMAEAPGFGASDTVLAVTTVMFDIALLELFLPLITGGRVVIAADDDVADGFRLADRANRDDITVMQATPTLWDMLLDAGLKPRPGLKMLAGGEPMPADLAERLMQGGAELWNMYGPTETTVWSAIKRLQPGKAITIGAPVANTDLWVLDAQDQPVAIGVTGELNIGGAGLANGYFGREDLTGAAFRDVDLPVGTRRLYRTGDMARLTPSGEVEVLRRRDGQIKLRGFRIELGDIETRLRALPGVDKAAVALKTRANGVAQLVAYVVARQGAATDMQDLSRALSEQLPAYMVPQGWVQMTALPQTANGKLERKALPNPDDQPAVAQPVAAPSQAKTVEILRPAQNLAPAAADNALVDRIAAILGGRPWPFRGCP